MASSSSFEVLLSQRGHLVARIASGAGGVVSREISEPLDGAAPFEVAIRREGPLHGTLRVTIEDEDMILLLPGDTSVRAEAHGLDGEFGDVVLRCIEERAERDGDPSATVEVLIEVRASAEVVAAHAGVLADLERVHRDLALDVIARTHHRGGGTTGIHMSAPEEELARLARLERRMTEAVHRIGSQPSTEVRRTVERRRWKPGVRLRPHALRAAILDPETKIENGRIVALGRAVTESSELSRDIAEHRQIRSGIERLRARCRALQRWCAEAALQLTQEAERWGGDRSEDSIYHQATAPRLDRLETIADRALRIDHELRQIIEREPFLRVAGGARMQLAPTPLFLNRPEYRQAYVALRELNREGFVSFTGDELRLRFKAFSRLYEYWCFIAVVELLSEILESSPFPSRFNLVDDLYRPDLAPGQTFRFEVGGGVRVFATYEPDIRCPSDGDSLAADVERPSSRWVAELSTAPLRPDIVVEVSRPNRPPCALVLDAKCRWHFDRHMLWEASDYRTRVFDPATGAQPIRQVFFLHPNARARNVENMRGYLAARRGSLDNSIIGAVGFAPDHRSNARLVIARFVDLAAIDSA